MDPLDKLISVGILTLNLSRELSWIASEGARMATTKVTARDLRRTNRSAILRTLYFGKATNRLDLGLHTGLSMATVTNVVTELLSEGSVVEAGVEESQHAAASVRAHRVPTDHPGFCLTDRHRAGNTNRDGRAVPRLALSCQSLVQHHRRSIAGRVCCHDPGWSNVSRPVLDLLRRAGGRVYRVHCLVCVDVASP